MRATKPLIYAGITVFGLGVVSDIAANAGLLKGDGHDHTVPRVPASVAAVSGAPVATTTNSTDTAVYISNNTTGDEYRLPPRDYREHAAYRWPPAANFIYINGKTRG